MFSRSVLWWSEDGPNIPEYAWTAELVCLNFDGLLESSITTLVLDLRAAASRCIKLYICYVFCFNVRCYAIVVHILKCAYIFFFYHFVQTAQKYVGFFFAVLWCVVARVAYFFFLKNRNNQKKNNFYFENPQFGKLKM